MSEFDPTAPYVFQLVLVWADVLHLWRTLAWSRWRQWIGCCLPSVQRTTSLWWAVASLELYMVSLHSVLLPSSRWRSFFNITIVITIHEHTFEDYHRCSNYFAICHRTIFQLPWYNINCITQLVHNSLAATWLLRCKWVNRNYSRR